MRNTKRPRIDEEVDRLWEAETWDDSMPVQPQEYIKVPLVMLLFIRRIRLLEVMLGISDFTLAGIMPYTDLDEYQPKFDVKKQKVIAECKFKHKVHHINSWLTSDVLQRYILFRKSRLNLILTEDTSKRSPVEDEVFTYLNWIKKVLFAIEHDNQDLVGISLNQPSYEIVARLNEYHPVIPRSIDFYRGLLSNRQTAPIEIVHRGNGFKSITQPRPLINALKGAIKKLQESKSAYYNEQSRAFFSERHITALLGDFVQNIQVQKEAESGPNRIDLLLKENKGDTDLAVEAKIILKNNSLQKDDIKKALFTQVPSYAEVVNRESCALLYIFDAKISDAFSGIKNIVSEESKSNSRWMLVPSKANDYIHLKLIHEIEDMKKQYDVFLVVLQSKSNSKRHKER
ncbi:hypothetical protein [Vibrio rotiferianus]|uniref:hypothetical protein n=1 Tax=Vibrio rotiferianus TaxID=190895 RepID=UPI00390B4E02